MCPNSEYPREEMDIDDASEVLKLVRKISCDFVGIGEPLLYAYWEEMFSIAAQTSSWVFVSTNANTLDEDKAKKLVHAGINKIGVSISGGDSYIYRSVHGTDGFQRALDGVHSLVHARSRLGRKQNDMLLPQIQFCFVTLKRNFRSLPNVIRLAAGLGIDMVRAQNAVPHTEILSDLLYPIPNIWQPPEGLIEEWGRVLSEANETAQELGMKFYCSFDDLDESHHGCGERQLDISANGSLTVCSVCKPDIRIAKGKIVNFEWMIGNLHSDSLADLLASEKY